MPNIKQEYLNCSIDRLLSDSCIQNDLEYLVKLRWNLKQTTKNQPESKSLCDALIKVETMLLEAKQRAVLLKPQPQPQTNLDNTILSHQPKESTQKFQSITMNKSSVLLESKISQQEVSESTTSATKLHQLLKTQKVKIITYK